MRTNKLTNVGFFITLLHIVLLLNSDSQPRDLKNEVEAGKLFCFSENREYWSELTDYCVKDNSLYVLYGDKGVLEIYDGDGNYLKSYAFHKTKGQSELRTDGSHVYLIDQVHNLYVFSSGECVDYIPYSGYKEYLQIEETFSSSEEQKKDGGWNYYTKISSIYRTNGDSTSVQVLSRPVYLLFFQEVMPLAVIFFWGAVFAAAVLFRNKGAAGSAQ